MTARYPEYFTDYIRRATELELLDSELMRYDLDALGTALKPEQDQNFTYLGLQTLYDRYFIHSDDIRFAFPPAFMKEARLRVAAEWTPADLVVTRGLIESGALSLEGLVTHTAPASDAAAAYQCAFENPECLKMILDWSGSA